MSDETGRRPALRAAWEWGLAASLTLFAWALASEVSVLWPVTFQAVVRPGAEFFSSAFALSLPGVDGIALFACAIFVLAVFEVNDRGSGAPLKLAATLPAAAMASFTLSPGVLLPLGAAGTVALAAYVITESGDLIGVSSHEAFSCVVTALFASTAALFVASGATWVVDGFSGAAPLTGWTWGASLLALKLTNMAYGLMPVLVALLFVSWAVRLMVAPLRERLRRRLPGAPGGSGATPHGGWMESENLPLALLVTAMAASLLVGVYPYLPAINPQHTLVGYDVRTFYYPYVTQMLARTPRAAVAFAFQNDRTLFILLDYGLSVASGSASLAAVLVTPALALLLTAATYILVREGSKDRLLAGTAALFTPFSLLTVSGINGGFLADWLAASEALLLFLLLFVGFGKRGRAYVALSGAVSVLLLLTHPWTWTAVLAVLVAYCVLTASRSVVVHDRAGVRFELLSVAAVLGVSFSADVLKKSLVGLSGTVDVFDSTSGSLSVSNVPHVLGSLALTLRYFLGGALENSVIISLAIVGVLTLPGLGDRFGRLLISWMAVTSAGVFLYGYSAVSFFQARIIMLAPIQILSAMGFLSIVRYTSTLMGAEAGGGRRLVNLFVLFAYLTVVCAALSYTLRDVGVIYTGT